ncbi:hypothetical protein BDW59DRAFT_169304 [Aspergillus cavernicola]|uniref:ABC1 atypical kinase-like domain-containing protein n=1 Tax=Aspergillus cavernicola TaxID=176166 RepID=A0ABR4IX92_9EURO
MSRLKKVPAIQSPTNKLLYNEAPNTEELHCPSLVELFSKSVQLPPAIESPQAGLLSVHEQQALLHSVEDALKQAELSSDAAIFAGVPSILFKLWDCQSQHLAQATEALANGSRNPSLRAVYGQTGILGFFLRLIASKEVTESSLILHCLRLIGNSCADTDENRAAVVENNYTFVVLRQLLRPELIQVVIPVIYNLCIDYEPAQTQLAANKIVYILLRLTKDGVFDGNDGLFDYVCELMELVGEQVLRHSLSFNPATSDDAQAVTQSRLKINQALAELSASPLFAELYPLNSTLSQTLKVWLTSKEDQFQICACVMLGNLARSDEVCEAMVRELKIHEELIAVLRSNARGSVLHSALGFLKNLAIASDNKLYLGEAGIIPAIAGLWGYETVPQVQLAATSIARQLVISSIENISRLLEPAAVNIEKKEDGSSDSSPTYLSDLLALFEKSDSTPIKTEIGRIVASLCRTLVPKSRSNEQGDINVNSLLDCLFTHHEGIALPLGAMATQTQWPVVRSEAWFALALMASTKAGAEAVVYCLQEIDGLTLIEQTLSAEEPSSDNETHKVQWRKDLDNIVVLVQELLKNDPDTLDASWRSTIQDLVSTAFLKLAETKDEDKTGEKLMLEASRQEIKHDILEKTGGLLGLKDPVILSWAYYVYDTIATGFRFVHLVVIFLPLILTVPTLWLGRRIRDRDGIRTGTLWWYRFLVRSMERAGPAFIKLGQWAASRTDIFPPEMCNIMSSLHSHAPAHSLHETKRTIRKAFNGLPFEEIFEEFNEKPLGVGAIAQVYKAKLKPNLANLADNERTSGPEGLRNKFRKNVDVLVKSTPQRVPSSYVAVKVLHPRVERLIRRDLRIMHFFASLINAIPTMHWLSFPDEVSQFGEMMKLQLDLRIEASNLKIFREKFRSRTTAWFPYPYLDYSTREVLVEEFAQGIPLSTFLEKGGGVYQHEIANEGLDAFLHMLLIDNFVHADLHPGNIMVRFYQPSELDLSLRKHSRASEAPTATEVDVAESVLARLRPHTDDPDEWGKALNQLNAEGYRPQLIFIDTGLVTQLNDDNRANFLDLFRAVAEFDGHRAGELMVNRCRQPEEVIDADIFALRMQHLVLGVKSRTFALGSIKIGDVLSEVLSMVRHHHVRLEGDFVNVVISILLLEGIGRSMDPNLDLFKSALPILRKLGSNTTFLKTVRSGDTSMLRVWVGLEARGLLQASIESVERCVKYDLLSPNI